MDLLQRVEECLEGGAAKVGDGAQACEQTPVQHLLEVPLTDVLGEEAEEKGHGQQIQGQLLVQRLVRPPALAILACPAHPHTHKATPWLALTHQHGGPEVELLSQLGDVDVYGHQVLAVILLHLSDDISQPFKLPLGPRHPDEVDLGKQCWSLGPSSSQRPYLPGITTPSGLRAACASPQAAGGSECMWPCSEGEMELPQGMEKQK